MWMFSCWHELEQIDHVDETDLQVGKLLAQNRGCSESFQRYHITGADHHYVRLMTLVVAGPRPNANSFLAVPDGSIDVEILEMRMFVRHDRSEERRVGKECRSRWS